MPFHLPRALVLLGALLVALLSFWSLSGAIKNNQWSVYMAKEIFGVSSYQRTTFQVPPGHRRAFFWQGKLALEKGNLPQAMNFLEQGLTNSPNDQLLIFLLGNAWEQNGDVSQAASAWRQVGAEAEIIDAIFRAVNKGSWEDVLILVTYVQPSKREKVTLINAWALYNTNAGINAAINLLKDAEERWPHSKYIQEWMLQEGSYLCEVKRWDEAVSVYRGLIEQSGEYRWRAYIGLGRALYYSGMGLGPSSDAIQVGITLKPKEVEGYLAMAEVLRGEKRFDEADEWYREAIEIDPQNVWIVSDRAGMLIQAGKNQTALEALNNALQIFPDEAHLYYLLGIVYTRLEQESLAIESAHKAIALDNRGNPGYLDALGTIYEHFGQYEAALSWYKAAVEMDPQYQAAVNHLEQITAKLTP